jgi:hypothetical protein
MGKICVEWWGQTTWLVGKPTLDGQLHADLSALLKELNEIIGSGFIKPARRP